jgi:hypothetical protein
MWMLIKGNNSHLCGKTPTDLRMGVPAPTITFACLSVTLIQTQRIAAINSPYQSGQDARMLEDWLEMQPQRIAMLWINADTHNVVVWVTSQFSAPFNN